MQKKIYFGLILIFTVIFVNAPSQEDYLKITASVDPRSIKQGEEGTLKIKITPSNSLKISSHPEFMIKLDKNNNISFAKLFFTASELDLPTRQENDAVFLDLDKEVSVSFKVNEDSLLGRHRISGEVVFTAVFKKDNWSLKTYQKFTTNFTSKRNRKIKNKKKL
jgi:hypothetical protein